MNLTLKNVEVCVGAPSKALFAIDALSIPTGSRLLVRGPSGAGKTTFLHLVAGLLKPTSGSVTAGDLALETATESQRSRFRRDHVSIVFQKLNLLDHLTALENVQLAKDVSAQSALRVLDQVGLSQKANELVASFSLGEQQRVAVARTLASHVSLILADEPTSSLDDRNAAEVMKLLVEASAGKSLIVVSHDHRIEPFFNDIRSFGELVR